MCTACENGRGAILTGHEGEEAMLKRMLVVVVALVGILALAVPARGQQYPPEELFIFVSDTTPTPGQTITVTAGTFAPGSTVTITFRSTPRVLGEDDDDEGADESGRVVRDVTIPADATLGTHTITASGTAPSGAPRSLSTTVTVVPAGAGAGAPGAGVGAPGAGVGAAEAGVGAAEAGVGAAEARVGAVGAAVGAEEALPRTGDDSIPLLRVGLVTLAVGAGLVFVTRRRRAAAAP
jgi:LPXTG-motif cell wall-anchored protein